MQKFFVNLITCFIPSKQIRHAVRKKYITDASSPVNYGIKHIYTGDDAEDIISNALESDAPALVCRYGGTEMRVVSQFLKHINKRNKFSPKIKKMISDLSGFYPADEYNLSRFSSEFLELLKDTDVMGVWNTKGEKFVSEHFLGENTKLVALDAINSINYKHPWSKHLKGKKVLVIHPFEESIREQYKKRELLFENKDTLPDFELITMKPVQSLADNKDNLPYSTWFEALDAMKKHIDSIDFDIAIIGAGAYGIFLAHHCKMIGKKAVHMGGATQILFGITGKRWENKYDNSVGKLINEHWVRPMASERPKGAEKVEGGCYW